MHMRVIILTLKSLLNDNVAVVLRDLRKFLSTISNRYHNCYYIGTIWFVLQAMQKQKSILMII